MSDGAGLLNQENFSEKRNTFSLIFFISYFPYRMNPSSLLSEELDFQNENLVKTTTTTTKQQKKQREKKKLSKQ